VISVLTLFIVIAHYTASQTDRRADGRTDDRIMPVAV